MGHTSHAPAAPPPPWSCGGRVTAFFDMPTDWWSLEEQGLVITFSINFSIACCCMLAFLVLSRVPLLARHIYSPLAADESGPGPWAPHTWLEVLSQGTRSAPLSNIDAISLDRTMLLRFMRFNLRLFGGMSLIAVPVMLPLNAARIPDGSTHLTPPPPDHEKQRWGGLESLAITHIPPGSPRYLAPTLFMYVFTWWFFFLLKREWKAYVRLRHEWLAQPRPEALTVLLRLGKARLGPDEVGVRLRRLWPGQVHAVMPVRPESNHAHGGRAGPAAGRAAAAAAKASAAAAAALAALERWRAELPPRRHATHPAELRPDAALARSYLVLFRTRRAASACARAAAWHACARHGASGARHGAS